MPLLCFLLLLPTSYSSLPHHTLGLIFISYFFHRFCRRRRNSQPNGPLTAVDGTPTGQPPAYEPGPMAVNNAVQMQAPPYNPNHAGFGSGQPQFPPPPSVQKGGLPSAPTMGSSLGRNGVS